MVTDEQTLVGESTPPKRKRKRKTIEIGTSDRVLFKRCRRRWNWQSESRMALQPKEPTNIHLFIGTGIHFALEDYHGIRHFADPRQAFTAYIKVHDENELPVGWDDSDYQMCVDMLDYYVNEWEPQYIGNQFRQLWLNSQPMTEVRFKVPFARMQGINRRMKVGRFVYTGTFDRIVTDEHGRFWIVDYKTASQFDTSKLELDPQVAAYTWAAQHLFGVQFEGVIWIQLLKNPPGPPRRLDSGSLSKAKDQRTTYTRYFRELMNEFGQVPSEYRDVLNALAERETEFGDRFIRYDPVRKNQQSIYAEENKMIAEAQEMANSHLPLYPNPTRDCSWDCPFRSPCIAMDDGYDYGFILDENYEHSPSREERDVWRKRIDYPQDPVYAEVY